MRTPFDEVIQVFIDAQPVTMRMYREAMNRFEKKCKFLPFKSSVAEKARERLVFQTVLIKLLTSKVTSMVEGAPNIEIAEILSTMATTADEQFFLENSDKLEVLYESTIQSLVCAGMMDMLIRNKERLSLLN